MRNVLRHFTLDTPVLIEYLIEEEGVADVCVFARKYLTETIVEFHNMLQR